MIFNIVGDPLSVLIREAFFHLQDTEGQQHPALKVRLWDAEWAKMPRPIGDLRDCFVQHEPFGDGILTWSPDDRMAGLQTLRVSAILDLKNSELIGCVVRATDLSYFEVGKPLQPLLFRWYMTGGVLPLHSALVARNQKGILLGGVGGSGKSTTALACAHAGFTFLGDDYIGLTQESGVWQGWSLYASAWLEDEHARRLSWIPDRSRLPGVDSGEMKRAFSVSQAFPESLGRQSAIVALALPHVTTAKATASRKITPAEALRRLAPSSILQLPFIEGRSAFERLMSLVRSVPSYDLALGTDPAAIPHALDALLQ